MTAGPGLRAGSAIVGVGETAMSSRKSAGLEELVVQSALLALKDAGLTPRDVDGIITDDEFAAVGVSGSALAGLLGIRRTFMVQGPSAGAGYAYAPLLAAMAFASGEASVVLCSIGIDWAAAEPGVAHFGYVGENTDREAFELPFGFVGTPVFYAMAAQRYHALYGLKEEQLGALAIAIRNNGFRNPHAQRRAYVTMDDYFASPYLAKPLRVLDTCLRTTGAASFVLTTPEKAKTMAKRPVFMLGAGYAASATSRRQFWTQREEFPGTATSVAAARAYAMSGLSPDDIDIAEIQDPYTIAVLLQLEACGFCGKGEAGAFVERGEIDLGGRLPLNTHGGQLSHGYLASVTHIIEAVRQLRGEAPANQVDGARTALVSGLGPGDCGVLILGREG